MYRGDLKAAIITHPLWTPQDPTNPPIVNLFLNDFFANGKKTKTFSKLCMMEAPKHIPINT
jgi:hypothetical protein